MLVTGMLNAQIDANVLALAQRDLKLRHDIPVRRCMRQEVLIRDHFHHRCPHAPHALRLAKRLAERRSPEERARRFRCIGRLVGSRLQLHEAFAAGAIAQTRRKSQTA